MTPMKNSCYFQPMQHKVLPDIMDIRKYALKTDNQEPYFVVVKPRGLDVFVLNGDLYDFNNNKIVNKSVLFRFEKLLDACGRMQMTAIGVLVSPSRDLLYDRRYMYTEHGLAFEDTTFVVYDTVFPRFNDDHDYKWRYESISKKAVAVLPNCTLATCAELKTHEEINKFALDVFSFAPLSDIIVYKQNGKHIQGSSQLYYSKDDIVSFIISPTQKYRTYIKRVVSTTYVDQDNNKTDIALYIVAKFKKEYIEIPLEGCPISVRRYIWENKSTLKSYPFWFIGYTLIQDGDYITIVDKFLSFITTW